MSNLEPIGGESSAGKRRPSPDSVSIVERATSALRFNVMPDRPVEETLHITGYRVGENFVEANFDRSYRSSMEASPSHLIFLSAVIHAQKMIYVYACHALGLPYDPSGPEVLKVWPTLVNVAMDRMIRDESDLVHRMHVDTFQRVSPKRYHIEVRSEVNGILRIDGRGPVYLL